MFHDRALSALVHIEESGLHRKLRPPMGLDCSSNDYLGLHNHAAIIKAVQEALEVYGFGSTASRLIRGDRPLTHEVEAQMASFKQTQGALYFHTGYAANLGLLQAVAQQGDVIFSDRFNHASLIDGIRLSKATCFIYEHLDVDHLEQQLKEAPHAGMRFLVTESLFSMDGDIAPLDRYAELCARYHVELIVDEAHAVGLYGQKRSGLIEHFGIGPSVLASSNAMGKAMGCFGSFVCGNDLLIEYLIQKARTLIFSTASPPSLLAAISTALQLIQSSPDRHTQLFKNIHLFSELLTEAGLLSKRSLPSPIFPIHIGDNHRAVHIAQSLQAEGFDIRAIRPPTVAEGSARLRVVVHAHTDTEHITALATAIRVAMERN